MVLVALDDKLLEETFAQVKAAYVFDTIRFLIVFACVCFWLSVQNKFSLTFNRIFQMLV